MAAAPCDAHCCGGGEARICERPEVLGKSKNFLIMRQILVDYQLETESGLGENSETRPLTNASAVMNSAELKNDDGNLRACECESRMERRRSQA
ncbi:PORR domain-containing protein [Psidium guajava]|nr:PORR domain-containing protein [Psidium guajava]